MPKIRVLIDTSALRSDPKFASAASEALARYAEEEYLEILIPQVVAGEFSSLPGPKLAVFDEMYAALNKFRGNTPEDLHDTIAGFKLGIRNGFEELQKTAQARFDQWIARTGATILPVAPGHGDRVMKRYFAGEPPFRRPKFRDDIPDAFIVETILDLAATGSLFVVVGDKRLADACKGISGITVFGSAKELAESHYLEDEIEDLRDEVETANEQENVKIIASTFVAEKEKFVGVLEPDVLLLVGGRTLTYRNPDFDEKDGSDELYIESGEEVSEWTIDGEYDYLGEGVILVSFEARVEVSVDDPMASPRYDDSGDRDYSRTVKVGGAISVDIDRRELLQTPSPQSAAKFLKMAKVGIDELDYVSLVDRSY